MLCDIIVAIQKKGMDTSFLNFKMLNKRTYNLCIALLLLFMSHSFISHYYVNIYLIFEQCSFILLNTTSTKHEHVKIEPKNTKCMPTKKCVWDSLVFSKHNKCTSCTLQIHNNNKLLTLKPFINLNFPIVSLFKATQSFGRLV